MSGSAIQKLISLDFLFRPVPASKRDKSHIRQTETRNGIHGSHVQQTRRSRCNFVPPTP